MSGCLLDTNVLSELRKEQRCDAGVRQWFEGTAGEELFISVLVLGEIRQGIERIHLRDPAQARALEKWLLRVATDFADRLLPVDQKVADQWGSLDLKQPVPILEAFLAATALVHGLTVVSRDEEDFRNTGVPVVNPFSKSKPKAD
ncbi:MAG TPA: type II toxin-antitoxin system VapC family toxin [Candidatus Saccharimonadales bacterium]|nr:type II toxin-antitoxin system VapC family toxin [Candidatus Saccharimonadales bacterium]